MILDLSAICSNGNTEEEKEVQLTMEAFNSKTGVFPIVKKEPFKLHLASVDPKRLLIQGELDVTISIPCDRCLAEVPAKFHVVIDRDIPIGFPEGALQGPEESLEEKGETDPAEDGAGLEQTEYMNGYQLDADRLVYGEILLAWPMKVLCKDDCRGLCPKCGANLNQTECNCDRAVPDPRMAAFQDVFNKFKEV